MNHILKDLVDEGHVIVYLDDILVFTDTREEHRRLVRRVLEALRKHKLYLRPEKCAFEKTTVDYLGTIVGNGELRMDPAKVSTVMDWPVPKNKKDVQSFIGFCNFYRRFIDNYSKKAKPMTRLLRKGEVWKWGEAEQASFDELKQDFVEAPVLAMPDM